MAYSHLQCPYCNEVRTTARGLYWHLRYEHDLPHYEAYDSVGQSMRDCRDTWGADDDLKSNGTDWHYNKVFWNKNYNSRNVDYFDKRDFR